MRDNEKKKNGVTMPENSETAVVNTAVTMERTANFLPFEDNNDGLRRYLPDRYVFHYRAVTDEEKAYLENNREICEKIPDPAYRDWIWKTIDTGTGKVEYHPSVAKSELTEKKSQRRRWGDVFVHGRHEIVDAVIPHVEGEYLILRMYRLSVWNYMTERVNLYEYLRLVYHDGRFFLENRHSVRETKPLSILSPSMAYIRKAVQPVEYWVNDEKNADFYRFLCVHFPWCREWIANENMPFTGYDADLLSLLNMISASMKKGRVYKCVPDKVAADLGRPFMTEIPGNIFNSQLMQVEIVKGFVPVAMFCFAEPVGDDMCVLHGVSYRGEEVERLYLHEKKPYGFVYSVSRRKWVSARCRDLFLMHTADHETFFRGASLRDSAQVRHELAPAVESTTGLHFPEYPDFHLAVSLYGQSRYLWFEQAVKIGLGRVVENFTLSPGTEKMTLSEFLGINGNLFRYIPPNLHISSEKYRAYLRIGFEDRRFLVKNSDILAVSYDNLEILRKHYGRKKRRGAFEGFVKALTKRCIKNGPTPGNSAGYRDPYTIARDLNEYCDYIRITKVLRRSGYVFREYLKPSEIHTWHQRVSRLELSILQKKQLTPSVRASFRKAVGASSYARRKCVGDDFSVIVPAEADDLIDEGAALDHCVGGYVGAVTSGRSQIYFLRRTGSEDVPYYTMEVRDGELTQCYGIHDTIDGDVSRKRFISDWCAENKLEIACRY